MDRLTFNGYELVWHGLNEKSYTAFSGPADESARESDKDIGPTPQGFYSVDPNDVEVFDPSDDWGEHRVKITPYRETVSRMRNCFKVVRTNMYIHGGAVTGTHGCIEINDDGEEYDFFKRLKQYGNVIELEVRYIGRRKEAYEDPQHRY
jgi:hypothetical protein